jgi:hypothetical protein
LDEKLYEKYDPAVLSGGNLDFDHSVEYVYITFRSMIAKDIALHLFKNGRTNKVDNLKFDEHFFKITTPTSPS